MIRMVVDAKNDGLADRFCTTTPSKTRLSRTAACIIQRSRSRLELPSTEGRVRARRLARTARNPPSLTRRRRPAPPSR
jgi:hypothetical protein